MDPVTADVVAGLTVNALTRIAGPTAALARGKPHLDRRLASAIAGDARAHAVTLLAEMKRLGAREQDIDKVLRFLRFPEADMFAHALAVAILTGNIDRASNEEDLHDQLRALLVLLAEIPEDTVQTYAPSVFALMHSTVQRGLENLQQLAPPEYGRLRDIAQAERSAGYLKTLANRTDVYRSRQLSDLADVFKFARSYIGLLRSRTSELIPHILMTNAGYPLTRSTCNLA